MNSNVWIVIGFIAQGLFASRFIIQWIVSEKKGESIIPVVFWYISLAGGLMLLTYAIYKKDPVFILGQSTGAFIYIRNLILILSRKNRIKRGTPIQDKLSTTSGVTS